MTKKLQSLLMSAMVFVCANADNILSIDKNTIDPNQSATISYKDMPAGSYLYIYQDAAPLPLKLYQSNLTTDPISGTLITDDFLLPYKNTICLQQGEDFENLKTLESAIITVNELPFAGQEHNVTSTIKMMVMNDIHVMAPELVVTDGKALQDVVEGDRKMLRESAEIFVSLIDTIIANTPQLVLIPGDLTKDGEKVSHKLVADQLKRLQQAGIKAFVVPGNHDVKNPHAKYFDGDQSKTAEDILEADFMQIYHDFGYNEDINQQDPNSLSYCAEPTDGLTIIGIDATRCRENLSTQHGDAQNSRQDYGRLTEQTLQWVLDRADEAKRKGRLVVAMMHHQLLQHFTEQATVFPSAAVEQGDSIAQLFIQHGIHVILTGHMHITNNTTYYNETRTDSIVEISTGATVSYPIPYRMITVDTQTGLMQLSTRNLHTIAGHNDLQVYSRDELAARVDKLMSSVANMFSREIDEALAEAKAQAGDGYLIKILISKFESALPESNSERAKLAYRFFGEPFTLAMLTASEGNEERKLTELLDPMIYAGIDSLTEYIIVEGDFRNTELVPGFPPQDMSFFVEAMTGVVKLLLQGKEDVEAAAGEIAGLGLGQMIDKMKVMISRANKIKQSLLEDISYLDTQYENKTDDLFLMLQLPIYNASIPPVTAVETIQNAASNNLWYDLLGRPISKPTEQGFYIHQGKVVVRH